MGIAVGAALKKVAVAILAEPKVLKNLGMAVLVVVVAMILPTVFVVSLFKEATSSRRLALLIASSNVYPHANAPCYTIT